MKRIRITADNEFVKGGAGEGYEAGADAQLEADKKDMRELFEEIENNLEPDGHVKIYPSKYQALKEKYL